MLKINLLLKTSMCIMDMGFVTIGGFCFLQDTVYVHVRRMTGIRISIPSTKLLAGTEVGAQLGSDFVRVTCTVRTCSTVSCC